MFHVELYLCNIMSVNLKNIMVYNNIKFLKYVWNKKKIVLNTVKYEHNLIYKSLLLFIGNYFIMLTILAFKTKKTSKIICFIKKIN